MDSLDQAVLRRFDLKIRFNALQSKQREKLFSKSAEKLGFQVDPTALSQLQSLENLTPGDFSNVIRQSRFRPINDQTDLLGRLKAECNMKQGAQSRRIGF
jgi:AAA+ superfamily predicted ATPase